MKLGLVLLFGAVQLLILAQNSDPTTLAGGAGWVGAGLLGLVLGWLLLVHLPAKDKQLQQLLDGKDKQMQSILDRKWEMIQKMSADYKESIREVAAHCQQEMSEMSKSWREELTGLTGAIHELSNLIRERREE